MRTTIFAHLSGSRAGLIAVLVLVTAACGNSGRSEGASTTTTVQIDTSNTTQVDAVTTTVVAPTTSATPSSELSQVSVERPQYRDSGYEGTNGEGSVVDIHVPDGSDQLATVVLLHGFGTTSGSADLPLKRFAPEIAKLGAVVFEFHRQSTGFAGDSCADRSCIGHMSPFATATCRSSPPLYVVPSPF